MSWNYRVMTLDEGKTYGIHEVYYREDGSLRLYSAEPMDPHGDTVEELQRDLEYMQKALGKPVLSPKDFPVPGPHDNA